MDQSKLNLVQSLRTLDSMVKHKLGPKEFRILLALHLAKCEPRPSSVAKLLKQPVGSVRVMFQTLRAKRFLLIHESKGGWPSYSISDLGKEIIVELGNSR